MNSFCQAIIKTLVYHDIFDYPLTLEEIHWFLIGKKASLKKIQVTINHQSSIINHHDGFYFLKGREEIVSLRKKREKISRKKLAIAKQVANWLYLIPSIKMIAITGALAMKNAKKSDDIDFLIVTSKNRLWLTRFLTILLTELLRVRRRPKDKKIANKICLNIFLDENHLSLPKAKRNLFTAHEIAQMKILWQKNNIYQRFLKENQWVKRYLPNCFDTGIQGYRDTGRKKNPPNIHNIVALFENSAYRAQLKYMKPKMTKEEVSPYFAFFHPKDRSKKILKKYEQGLKELNL